MYTRRADGNLTLNRQNDDVVRVTEKTDIDAWEVETGTNRGWRIKAHPSRDGAVATIVSYHFSNAPSLDVPVVALDLGFGDEDVEKAEETCSALAASGFFGVTTGLEGAYPLPNPDWSYRLIRSTDPTEGRIQVIRLSPPSTAQIAFDETILTDSTWYAAEELQKGIVLYVGNFAFIHHGIAQAPPDQKNILVAERLITSGVVVGATLSRLH